jgi:hypothetical protein
MEADDLARLGKAVRDSAVVLDDGEVMWPFESAKGAIDEPARLGRVVLGVDDRERTRS